MSDDQNFHDPEFIPPADREGMATHRRGRDQSRWLVLIAVGGCGCIVLPVLLIVVIGLGVGNTLFQLYQSSGSRQVYQMAARSVETNADVTAALGEPVDAGWILQVEEVYDLEEVGKVCMRFGVAGSDRKGSVYTEAQPIKGDWQIHQLIVNIDDVTSPIVIVPLTAAAQPLCPDFEQPESDEETLPDAGTAI